MPREISLIGKSTAETCMNMVNKIIVPTGYINQADNEKCNSKPLIGPCKGGPGILDSNFKRIADSEFKFQNHWILDSNF